MSRQPSLTHWTSSWQCIISYGETPDRPPDTSGCPKPAIEAGNVSSVRGQFYIEMSCIGHHRISFLGMCSVESYRNEKLSFCIKTMSSNKDRLCELLPVLGYTSIFSSLQQYQETLPPLWSRGDLVLLLHDWNTCPGKASSIQRIWKACPVVHCICHICTKKYNCDPVTGSQDTLGVTAMYGM